MIIVYHAANSLDANMIKSLLEQYQIKAYIQGEYLQGGVGELPVADLITVSVNDEDQYEAKKLIHAWEGATIVENQMDATIPLGGELSGAS